tara:strand:+ start:1730 stop:2827 length:1098 start_codon:yes stop_codon:yes gene_type:complete
MKILPVNTKSKRYNIYIGNNIVNKLPNILKKEKINFQKSLIIVDKNVPKNIFKKIKSRYHHNKKLLLTFNASEKNKNFKYINLILEMLFKNNFTRNDAIICIGGGIAGDVSSFAASIYKRGLKFINIPTTLLSQVDSSIGGKTGVNNKFGKNLIGSFYQPDLVVSDTIFLRSLPRREIICGYAEILKHSLINNKRLFHFLNNNLSNILKLKKKFIERAILESCKIKKEIIELDERESNLRKSLNFGHTFGHAYEASLNYSKKLNHGEAVLYGILSATKLSKKLKTLNNEEYQIIIEHLSKLKFDNLKKFFNKKDIDKIVRYMSVDKKNTSKKINFITLKKIGRYNLKNQLNPSEVRNFIKFNLFN